MSFFQTQNMGELVSVDDFVKRYGKRYGYLPESFYRSQTTSYKLYVPEGGELAQFLLTGDIFEEYPYRRVKYFVPPEERKGAFDNMVDAAGMCEVKFTTLPSKGSNSTQRMRLRGPYADERGRATIIVGMKRPDEVSYFTFTWHGVVAPPADVRPGPNVTKWGGRRAGEANLTIR